MHGSAPQYDHYVPSDGVELDVDIRRAGVCCGHGSQDFPVEGLWWLLFTPPPRFGLDAKTQPARLRNLPVMCLGQAQGGRGRR